MTNQVIVGVLFQEGTLQVKPPYFNGQYFSHWKVRMEIYAKSYDVKVLRVIKKGNYPLPVVAQPPADPEDIDEYIDEQMAVVQVNAKARNLLYNAISGEEYEKTSSCDTAKEMWDKLEVTYEGTSKVKETHINMLVHDYELFQMKEGESIEEIFVRFSKIISDLKAFGKPYLSGDQVRKILRNFEKTHLKKTNQEEKKKTVAFKATTERTDNDIDDDSETLQEEITMGAGQTRTSQMMIAKMTTIIVLWNEDILDLTLEESQKMMNEIKRLKREIKDGKLKLEVCKIEKEVLQDEVDELQMQLNGMRKSTSHSSEYHRRSRKEKWYLDSACSSHMTDDKNLFKEVTKIDGGNVKFGDNSKGKIVGTETVPFNNNCDITEVYLIDGLNYNLLSISQLCDSGYEVKFKKTGCAIEDETEESVHVIFDKNNTSAEKGITACDEDQTHVIQETSKSQKSTNKPDSLVESTNEISNSQSEPPEESTTHTVRPNEWRSEPEYPQKFIIGDPSEGMKTRGALKKKTNIALISQIEPKKIEEALKDSSWLQAMQEELDQFDKNQVWKLMPNPENDLVIGTKWVFRNKLNEDGKVVRNKARLVTQGYSQQEGVDYDETFTPVARLESIRILLAYASFKRFRLFQMDVKSAILNGFIEE
ncbi:uncharacterized protein [Nicotiana tomentosiformis]|uniref:uncharacterized protein n=1 Tax=Nicotiana tomentosiformis TaxID=4098 RepID=UPI00388C662A